MQTVIDTVNSVLGTKETVPKRTQEENIAEAKKGSINEPLPTAQEIKENEAKVGSASSGTSGDAHYATSSLTAVEQGIKGSPGGAEGSDSSEDEPKKSESDNETPSNPAAGVYATSARTAVEESVRGGPAAGGI